MFGNQSLFGGSPGAVPATTPTNVFGGSSAGASSFGGLAQGAAPGTFGNANPGASPNVFGGTTSTLPNSFEAPPNATPFGTTAAASPFSTSNEFYIKI